MINFKIAEKVLDNYYFAHNVGSDGILYHLSDDSFLGYSVDEFNIDIFNFYDCDFTRYDIDKTVTGDKHWIYKNDIDFSTFVDKLFEHEILGIMENTLEESKDYIKNLYNRLTSELDENRKEIHTALLNEKITMLEQSIFIKILYEVYPYKTWIERRNFNNQTIGGITSEYDYKVALRFYKIDEEFGMKYYEKYFKKIIKL